MKFSKLIMFMALMVMVVFTSCKKEEVDKIETEIEQEIIPEVVETNPLIYSLQQNNSSAGALDLGCFVINMPFDFLREDGTTTTINTEDDFEILSFDSTNFVVDWVYPLNITYSDGETGVVNNEIELGEAFASCVPNTGWGGNDGFPAYLICDINSCYQLVYPIDLNDGNGNPLTVTSEEEFIDAIAQSPELYFEFPLELTDEDGNVVEVTSEEELLELLFACDNISGPGDSTFVDPSEIGLFGCLEIVFPFDALDENGTATTITNEDDLYTLFLNGDFVAFSYPVSFTDGDGNVIVVNDDEELIEAIITCDGVDFPIAAADLYSGVESDCYEVVYPVTATDMNDPLITITIQNDVELMDAVFSNVSFFTIELPVEVTLNASNETVEIGSIFDFASIIEECQ